MNYLKPVIAICLLLLSTQCLRAQVDISSIVQPPLEIDVGSSYYQDADKQVDDDDERSETEVEDLIGNWPRKTMREARIDIREFEPDAPKDRSYDLAKNAPNSDWTQFYSPPKVLAWAAPNIRYRPLYFEDVALERYGQSCGLYLQPFKSGAHLFTSTVLSPLKIVHDHPFSCDYPLGFCRPGDSVPTTRQLQILGHSEH